MKKDDLNDRLFNFAVRVLKFLPGRPKTGEFNVIRYLLVKSYKGNSRKRNLTC